MSTILIIEDEVVLARQLARGLGTDGHDVRTAHSGSEGLAEVEQDPPDLVFLDLRLPDASGLDLLTQLRSLSPTTAVVMMTALGSTSDTVEAIRLGAADYLQKPLDISELRMLVKRLEERSRSELELTYLRQRDLAARDQIIGGNAALQEIFDQVERLATASLDPVKRPSILLSGETGTGKGVVARAIHDILGGGPFLSVNCTAMPATLVEAELFGHERGTFTDAKTARPGLFEAAEGGTIFLDEIGHAPLELQGKLLKAIEEKQIRRLGASRERSINVHVISATNRDLDAAVESGEFRRDLLHRLRVLSFELPPLRDRGDDVVVIARRFCAEIARTYGRNMTLSDDCEDLMRQYSWPGNVREVRNVLERAVLLETGDVISRALLARLVTDATPTELSGRFRLPNEGIDLAELERDLVGQALERAGGNRTRAGALLGLSRDALRYRLEKFGLEG